jgi:hypothetical protein
VIGDDESPEVYELPDNIFVSAASQPECSDAVKHYQRTEEFSPFEKFAFSVFAPHFFNFSQGPSLIFFCLRAVGIVTTKILQTTSVSQHCSVYPTYFLLFPSFDYLSIFL